MENHLQPPPSTSFLPLSVWYSELQINVWLTSRSTSLLCFILTALIVLSLNKGDSCFQGKSLQNPQITCFESKGRQPVSNWWTERGLRARCLCFQELVHKKRTFSRVFLVKNILHGRKCCDIIEDPLKLAAFGPLWPPRRHGPDEIDEGLHNISTPNTPTARPGTPLCTTSARIHFNYSALCQQAGSISSDGGESRSHTDNYTLGIFQSSELLPEGDRDRECSLQRAEMWWKCVWVYVKQVHYT